VRRSSKSVGFQDGRRQCLRKPPYPEAVRPATVTAQGDPPVIIESPNRISPCHCCIYIEVVLWLAHAPHRCCRTGAKRGINWLSRQYFSFIEATECSFRSETPRGGPQSTLLRSARYCPVWRRCGEIAERSSPRMFCD
jgi:hypothetical protein